VQALMHNKDLYLPATRDSPALYLHVDVPEGSTDEQKRQILTDHQNNRSQISKRILLKIL